MHPSGNLKLSQKAHLPQPNHRKRLVASNRKKSKNAYCGWNAAKTDAGSPNRSGHLDAGGLESQLRSLHGRYVPTGSAADDDDITARPRRHSITSTRPCQNRSRRLAQQRRRHPPLPKFGRHPPLPKFEPRTSAGAAGGKERETGSRAVDWRDWRRRLGKGNGLHALDVRAQRRPSDR